MNRKEFFDLINKYYKVSDKLEKDIIYISLSNTIKNGFNVNAKNHRGDTILVYSSYLNITDIIKLLLEHRVNINAKNHNGHTALMEAAVWDNIEIVELLLEHGADPNIKDSNSNTILNWVSNKKIKNLLIKYGAKQ